MFRGLHTLCSVATSNVHCDFKKIKPTINDSCHCYTLGMKSVQITTWHSQTQHKTWLHQGKHLGPRKW